VDRGISKWPGQASATKSVLEVDPIVSTNQVSQPAAARYAWASRGDINAFFGLMLDNLGDMILMATLLVGIFQMPAEFVLTKMIPGTAVGVMVGDLIYTGMAFRLARRTGRSDVTAMPLGLDTPSTFGSVFLVIGPAYAGAVAKLGPEGAARHAWYIAIAMLLASGIFKLVCAFVSGLIRRVVPRAGLLGSLTAIALVIISFLPLIEIVSQPIAGFVALALVLATLTARWELPRNIPGALGGLIVGCIIYYLMHIFGLGPGLGAEAARPDGSLRLVLPLPIGDWLEWFGLNWKEALGYLPVALPLALATVVGGIDCTESAAAAGDNYPTGPIIAAEGFATLIGGLFGGVIQSTPYIGHPAYKAMGARSAYTLATALFVGAAGIFGFFDWIFYILPKGVVFPILIFVGLEITAQSFHATKVRHFPAVALACVPALAYLAAIALKQVLPGDMDITKLSPSSQHWVQTVIMLSGGFIVTSLLWGTMLAHLIDGKIRSAVFTLLLGGVLAWWGVIHSPLPSSPVMPPSQVMLTVEEQGRERASRGQTPYHWAIAYWAAAASLGLLGRFGKGPIHDRSEDPIAI
jgi:AGZA family xanthine/uracil permease-like MFS transporter